MLKATYTAICGLAAQRRTGLRCQTAPTWAKSERAVCQAPSRRRKKKKEITTSGYPTRVMCRTPEPTCQMVSNCSSKEASRDRPGFRGGTFPLTDETARRYRAHSIQGVHALKRSRKGWPLDCPALERRLCVTHQLSEVALTPVHTLDSGAPIDGISHPVAARASSCASSVNKAVHGNQ